MRKVKVVKEKTESKEDWKWKSFYFFVLMIGIILTIFEINIFRKTLISKYIPISIILVTGFIGFLFNKKHFKKIYSTSGNFIIIIQNLVSWGFISCYLFMAINYYLARPIIENYKAKIIEKSSMPGQKGSRIERHPLVRFKYFDFEKELVFKFKDTEKVNLADSVKINLKKGRLGFDVLESYDVF
ncbi:hypothetical protein EV143_105247 [Flavobacterium chryseum]|uniref:hypothetical protein n=1 Tax=Flavobacterium sp. P3160 TaxID=2512113 RepID=UPI00105BE2C8|nr:hypothetical protein [Flavobacterium sp. P3160]TDO73649.1 hypothetical protein EV143_105247 [Flavobacterium sp. P3160]